MEYNHINYTLDLGHLPVRYANRFCWCWSGFLKCVCMSYVCVCVVCVVNHSKCSFKCGFGLNMYVSCEFCRHSKHSIGCTGECMSGKIGDRLSAIVLGCLVMGVVCV